MAKPTILNETPMSLSEVRTELDKIKKRDSELGFRAGKTEDYLNQFAQLSDKQAGELGKKIEALKIPRLKDIHIKKIVSLLPKTVEGLKLILQGYTITVKDEAVKKIIKVLEDSGALK